jgi:MoaA/NifB/PqqE/SkfB family radical SAM enzyme
MYNVTEVCPLRCKHCYNESGAGKYMPSQERLQIGLDKVINAGAGTINFTGGEPLVVPNMTSYVAYTRSRGLNTMLNTSGLPLVGTRGHQLLEELEGNLDLIKIGLSGATPETNDYIRGKGNFSIAVRALGNIGEHEAIASCLKVCLDKHNYHEVEDIVKFGLDNKVKEIFFGQLVNTGRARKELVNLELDYDELQRVADDLERVREKYEEEIRIAKYCTLNGKCLDQGIYYTVTARGAVGPCLIREDLALGNIHSEDVSSLFRLVDSRRKVIPTHSSLKDLEGRLEISLIRRLPLDTVPELGFVFS